MKCMRDMMNFVEIHIGGEGRIWREDEVEDALAGRAKTFVKMKNETIGV